MAYITFLGLSTRIKKTKFVDIFIFCYFISKIFKNIVYKLLLVLNESCPSDYFSLRYEGKKILIIRKLIFHKFHCCFIFHCFLLGFVNKIFRKLRQISKINYVCIEPKLEVQLLNGNALEMAAPSLWNLGSNL